MKSVMTIASLAICSSASAHHSYGEFDLSRTVESQGTVAKVEFSNPHSFVWMYVKNKQGGYELYALESVSPAILRRSGWTNDTLRVGEKITVSFRPLKDGRHGGSFIQAIHADGRVTTSDTFAPGGAKIYEANRAAPAITGIIK